MLRVSTSGSAVLDSAGSCEAAQDFVLTPSIPAPCVFMQLAAAPVHMEELRADRCGSPAPHHAAVP
jgi:hypothetical protein